jgi:GTPase-activating protein SST2
LAALAREKITSTIANIYRVVNTFSTVVEQRAHLCTKFANLSALHNSKSLPQSADSQTSSRDNTDSSNTNNTAASSLSHARNETADLDTSRPLLLETNPPSQGYSNTATDTPAGSDHNCSTRKLQQDASDVLALIAHDERGPAIHNRKEHLKIDLWGYKADVEKDFEDLFATLVVSLPLVPHRVRLTRVDHSFLSEEAINNLGSLKFSQSNQMPDPKDPSRIVTTTTITTFSMARGMARSVCQRYLDARFIESADGKQAKKFNMKGSVWQLTPKGVNVLERFCARSGIQQKHITELVSSPRNAMQLVILERDSATDKPFSEQKSRYCTKNHDGSA